METDVKALNLTARDRKFILEATKVVEEHLSEREFGVAEFCRLLGKNRVTMHRWMKLILDKPASEFIRDIRLDHAADLLKEGEFNVHQAANASGFYNQSYFSKCFKEKFHCLPSEFQSSVVSR